MAVGEDTARGCIREAAAVQGRGRPVRPRHRAGHPHALRPLQAPVRGRRVVPPLGADTALVPAATETAQQLKRTAGVPFHAKGRGPLRKMDTTSKPPRPPRGRVSSHEI